MQAERAGDFETARRRAERALRGRRIAAVAVVRDPIVYEGVSPARFAAALRGRRIEAVRRKGKHLWMELDRRPWPLFHFCTGGDRRPARGPVGEPVITVALPAGYGLTPSERHDGVDAVNTPQEVQVALANSLQAVLPELSRYCTTYPIWRSDPPPPPAWLLLRFSDAPGEEYFVYRSRKAGVYFVRDSSGAEIPESEARWVLHIGNLEPLDPPGARHRTWVLHVGFTRSQSAASLDPKDA